MSDLRRERFPIGMAHLGLDSVERDIPVNEPPALAPNNQLLFVGKSVARWDAKDKVTGAARYTVDLQLPGMLYAAVLRSPHPHARIKSIDLSEALALSGVRAAIRLVGDEQTNNDAYVRYVGQAVVAVAADTPFLAAEALRTVRIQYEILPFAVDMDFARQLETSTVYQSVDLEHVASAALPANAADYVLTANVLGPTMQHSRGDIKKGFAESTAIVDEHYFTQVQTHCCMEPHAIVASWQKNALEIWMSTQFTAGVRAEFARQFNLPLSSVRVHAEAIGGGFGSKSKMSWYGRAAVELSRLAGAPVRLVYSREEEQLDSGNRSCSEQHLRIAARADGSLCALQLQSYGSAGTAFNAGVGAIASAMYQCHNVDTSHCDIFMNTGPSTAMRGPGNTQGAFALEQSIDQLAHDLNLDPIAMRDKIDASPIRREERRLGAEKIGWAQRTPVGADNGPVKRGIGMAQSMWPALVQTNAACEVRLWRDGRVDVLSSVQDIGTGVGTTLIQVVAEELGVATEAIQVHIGDTEYPSGPPSYGSRTTASITPPARVAAWRVKQALLACVAENWQVDPEELDIRGGYVFSKADSSNRLSWHEASAMLRTDRISETAGRTDDYDGFATHNGDAAMAKNGLGGVQFAEVEVDTQTGVIRVLRVVAVQDCGRPINPKQLESQVQGGVLMGISYALLEERIMDRKTGYMLNPNLIDYKLLGICDMPEIDVTLLEHYQGFSATDAYGIAEPANIPTAPAIANAVFNAIGVRITTLPMTPDKVLAALESARAGGH